MKKQIIGMLCATALLSSCHIYKSYDRPKDIEASGLYRDTVSVADTLVSDTVNFGNLPWREVFTDPQLQALIEQGLTHNTDLLTAALKVKEAQASLMSARLAYAPSLGLSPQGTISSFDKHAATKTYPLPATASWEIDLFGKLLNAKRGVQVTLLQTKAYRQAVQTQIISGIANTYYTLLMLDRQLDITEQTADIMKRNVETMQAMKDAAMFNTTSAGVEQSKAAYKYWRLFRLSKRVSVKLRTLCPCYWHKHHRLSNGGFWKSSNYLKISQWAFLCNYSLTVRM